MELVTMQAETIGNAEISKQRIRGRGREVQEQRRLWFFFPVLLVASETGGKLLNAD